MKNEYANICLNGGQNETAYTIEKNIGVQSNMKKYVLFMISIGLILAGLLVYNVYTIQKQNSKAFEEAGYILQSANTQTQNVEKYYFNANEKYKTKYDQKVIFNDTNGDEVITSKDNFIHFNNGGISSLKKGVIIDLQKIDENPISYYSIAANKVLKKVSDKYVIAHLDGNLEFSSLIWKISDTKYLVAGNGITVHFNDGTSKVINGYVEIEYLDNQVIKIYNQELTYQTVSTQVNIEAPDGIKINLESKIVSRNNENKMSLASMVIDSDDNVEIVDLEEKKKEEEKNETSNETTNENNTQTNGNGSETTGPNGNGGNGAAGQGGTAGESGSGSDETNGSGSINSGMTDNDQIVEDTPVVNAPVFKVESFDIDSISVNAKILIEDDESKLVTDHTVKILQNNNGKVVYVTEETLGTYNIDLSVSTLSPDTEYTLVVESTYEVDGIQYTKNFIYKIFRTKTVGIDFEKDLFTNNSLRFGVSVDEDSKVKGAELTLVNSKGEIEQTYEVGNGTELGSKAEFVGLQPNTDYTIKLTNVLYDGQIITNGFEVTKVYRTLKNKPEISGTEFEIDKRNSTFTLRLKNVKDDNNGIVGYRYEMYDTRISLSEAPVYTKEITKNEDVIVKIDEETITRGVPYTFKVIAIFNDNEKEIEYESEYSDIMKMDGVSFPTVRFEKKTITFERIQGNLIIEDINHTISLGDDNNFIISYADSQGYTRSFTYQGSLTIPIDVNDLRANETYKFRVYTRVDLQDGNEPIDECYIGGAIIKTGTPNSLMGSFIQTDDTKNTFNVQFQLKNAPVDENSSSIDTIDPSDPTLQNLEANVLTGMEFRIYAGQPTQNSDGSVSMPGTPVRTVKLVDNNTKPYESQLKEEYYDTTAEITPAFFGAGNKDFKDQKYTIQVLNTYDYTYDGGNEIPLLDGLGYDYYVINANGYTPDYPIDVENTIDIVTVRNRDVTPRPREDLNAETVVGYQIKAKYDNSQNYAKKIIYYAYDKATGELVGTQEEMVGEDGVIPPTTFQVKDGTPYSTKDTEGLTRGNSYYFTYEAYLDLNHDGEPETKWPLESDNVELRSKVVAPSKQLPRIIMYPSTSGTSTATYKYKCNDVDHTLESSDMTAIQNGTALRDIKEINTNSGTDFEEITFENLVVGSLVIRVAERTMKADPVEYDELIVQYFEGVTNVDDISYKVGLEENRVIVTLVGNEDKINRITALKAVFSSQAANGQPAVEVEKDLLKPTNNMVTISYNELAELLNRETEVKLTAYYDNGVTGYDITQTNITDMPYRVYQKPYAKGETIYYYTINKDGNFVPTTTATANMYVSDRTDDADGIYSNLVITNVMDPTSEAQVQLAYSKNGLTYQNDPILPKQVSTQNLVCDGSNIIRFDLIIPGISMKNKTTNELDITAGLDDVQFNATLINKENVEIVDNKILVELWQTDENGKNAQFVREVEQIIDNFKDTVTIGELQPKTYYYIKFKANIKNADGEILTKYLYDVDYETVGKQYYFSTLANVGITEVNVKYVPVSYSQKTIDITYKLDKVLGYNWIDYVIYKYNKETDSYDVLMDNIRDELIVKEMKKSIEANPGSVFEFGTKYKVKIIPIALIQREGEEQQELDLGSVEHEFTLQALNAPLIGLNGYRSDGTDAEGNVIRGSTVRFTVIMYDNDRIVENDKYTIRIYNQNYQDITPEEYLTEYSTDDANRTFEITNADPSKRYAIRIQMNYDYGNDGNTVPSPQIERVVDPINESGISAGNISSANNALASNKIDLIFYNSYKITEIDQIRYSIYNTSGYNQSDTEKFVPSATHSTVDNDTYYTFTLNKNLPTEGRYYIEIQFLKDGQIVDTANLEHIYVEK